MNTPNGRIAINSVQSSYDENIPFWEVNMQDRIITFVTKNAKMVVVDTLTIIIGTGNNNNMQATPFTTANEEMIEVEMWPK